MALTVPISHHAQQSHVLIETLLCPQEQVDWPSWAMRGWLWPQGGGQLLTLVGPFSDGPCTGDFGPERQHTEVAPGTPAPSFLMERQEVTALVQGRAVGW